MKIQRIAMLTVLAAFAAGASSAQSDPYGPPGNQGGQGPQGQYGQQEPGYDPGQYEDDWRESDNWYDQQSNDGYDPNGRYGQNGPNGGYDNYGQPPSTEVGFFYGALSPYGEWVRHPYYGWVWFPRNVHAGWRPYSIGRWVMSDYGWTWVSYERFGWATYHYGRWAWDRYVGWLWVPGTDWAPAWVAWQQGNGYIGWAPLPPAVGFDLRVGIQLGGFNLSLGIAPRNYAFVEERRFLDSRIGGYIVPEARNVTIIHNTTNITNYTVVDNRVINQGVALDRVERVTGRRAQRMRIAQATAPGSTVVDRDVVRIYRPAETKLESVKVAERNNAGLRRVAKPGKAPKEQGPNQVPNSAPNTAPNKAPAPRPYTQEPKSRERTDVPIPVAPRVPPAPAKVNERQFTREQEELKANQQKKQQELQQMQRREKAQAPPPAQQEPKGKAQGGAKGDSQGTANSKGQGAARVDPQEVQKRHAAELEEQKVLRERTAEQLKNRQQLQRQAAQATAAEEAKAKGEAPPAQAGQKKGGKAKPEAAPAEPQKKKGKKDTKPQNEDPKPPQSL